MTAPTTPSRRALLAALPLAAAATLGGCRLRLEDGESIPFVPRSPVPDEARLVALVARLRETASAARSAGLAQVARDHGAQADVVTAALHARGVPAATISPTPTTATIPSASAPAATRAQVAAAEAAAAGPAELAALGALTTPVSAQVRSVSAYQARCARVLGARVPRPPAPTAATAVDAALLAAFRAAAYALDVAAARSGTQAQTAQAADPAATQRALLLADARWADACARALEVRLGQQAPAPPLGYALPFAVHTPADAKRLAAQTFSRLELAVGATLADASGPACAIAVDALADVLGHGARWGLPLRALPGLVAPQPATATPAPTASPTGTR